MKTTLRIFALAAAAAAAHCRAFAENPSAESLFAGSQWISAPPALKAAAPRFTLRFAAARDGAAPIAVCGLGQYVATLNGKPLGRGDEFNLPGWTRTSKTCFYNVFNPVLKAGAVNTLEITLGNGMYNVENPGRGFYTKFTGSEGPLRLLVGGAVKSGTAEWKVSPSEIVRTHVYAGDDIDATADTSAVFAPVAAEAPAGTLREAPFVCRLQEVRTPVRTVKESAAATIADLGQNASYVPRIVARGPRGSRIEVEFSEIPQRDGAMPPLKMPAWNANGRRRVRCMFTLAGTGKDETFEPPFFYYGFRYMRIAASPAAKGGALPELVSASARVVAADMPRAGSFECSLPLFNRIHDICLWAQRSNMQSVFTDCPHREKLGWQEQNNLHSEQIRWGWAADRLYAKTCMDLADSQLENGMCPDIAPEYTVFKGGFRDSIEWGASMILIPWQQYEWTGDDSLIRRYYPNMVAYHRYIARRSQDPKRGAYIAPAGLGDWYWQTAGTSRPLRRTSANLTATAFYYMDAVALAKCADLLGKKDDAAAFRAEAEAIRKAFNAKWWNPAKHCYENNSQTANAMAIVAGLADPAETGAIVDNIVEDVRWRGNSVSAGEIGYPFLLKALAENGRSGVIYDMTIDTEKPGYGNMIAKGNTTCHEAWNSGYGSSCNHFMMADIVDWFYSSLAGIKRVSPGFRTFAVKPDFLPGIDWVKASHKTPLGEIAVDWRRGGDGAISLAVAAPEGAECTVVLPGRAPAVQRGGVKVYTIPGNRPAGAAPARAPQPTGGAAAPGDSSRLPPGGFSFISPAGSWDGAKLNRDETAAAFAKTVTNAQHVARAEIFATSLGVFELYANDALVTVSGDGNRADFLRPGATDPDKRRAFFSYDITEMWHGTKGARNTLSAFVARSWFCDSLGGRKSSKPALAAKLRLTYADGSAETIDTDASWTASFDTPFLRAGIYYGEAYDARLCRCARVCAGDRPAEPDTGFKGETTPQEGPGVNLRRDLALDPVEAYSYRSDGIDGAGKDAHGRVARRKVFPRGAPIRIGAGDTLVIDFGQNAAAVPEISATAPEGVTLEFRGAEMLNDANGEKSRGCDGPAGSVYRANYRSLKDDGALVRYTFRGTGDERYMPTFTFMGYRYAQVTATGPVEIKSIRSIPVTSVAKSAEHGWIETGDKDVNKLVSNIRWGHYSNYVSIPTDCPQRDERMGWTADTQVFVPAAFRSADSYAFLRKWMHDMRDAQDSLGRFPGVAPLQRWGACGYGRLGWCDAGIMVPYNAWRMTGDAAILRENWAAMRKLLDFQRATRYRTEKSADGRYQWADWLSYEKYESSSGKHNANAAARRESRVYWNYLAGCHWYRNAKAMAEMAAPAGRGGEAAECEKIAAEARAYLRKEFFGADDSLPPFLLDMQTPHLFALALDLYDTPAGRKRSIDTLVANIEKRGNRLSTGFLGTAILMDTLTYKAGRPDLAYSLLLQHGNPGWLYSVDNGATTTWERWNSYTKEKGFGPVGMNSFNHYAYGSVLDWIYGTAAGIRPGRDGGFEKEFTLAPIPDRRIGHLRAVRKTASGAISSAWRYEGGKCVFDFTVPRGTSAVVTFDGKTARYAPGTYRLEAPARR